MASTDYVVASLPSLRFGEKAPLTWDRFCDICGGDPDGRIMAVWRDLETQLRNAMAVARNGAKFVRPANGCSLYWSKRVTDCFAESDVLKRDEMLDRVWWDAAGELTPPSDPLGKGALATYAIRLKIAIRRDAISRDAGNAAFDRLSEKAGIA